MGDAIMRLYQKCFIVLKQLPGGMMDNKKPRLHGAETVSYYITHI